jgi:hypothetical protein
VYVDDQKFGGVESLSSLTTQGISSVTRLNGIDATARFGLGHSAGVISVKTWRKGLRESANASPAPHDTSRKPAAP